MKVTKTFAIFVFLAAFLAASVVVAKAGDNLRVRCETSSRRAKIDVDVRGLLPNSNHTAEVSNGPSCTASSTRNADINGEWDGRFDTNAQQPKNNQPADIQLPECFKDASSITVTFDSQILVENFICTSK